jgi:phosphatidylethanolamine-binding protein (PEBP) family uncharacterized protein
MKVVVIIPAAGLGTRMTSAPSGKKPGATKQEVEQAMQGHTLGKAELMGKYQR